MFYIQLTYSNGHGALAFKGDLAGAKRTARELIGGTFAGRQVMSAWIADAAGAVIEV